MYLWYFHVAGEVSKWYHDPQVPESVPAYNVEMPGSAEKPRVATSLRMLPEEKQAFDTAADIAGLSLSAWLITRLRACAAAEIKSAGGSDPFGIQMVSRKSSKKRRPTTKRAASQQ